MQQAKTNALRLLFTSRNYIRLFIGEMAQELHSGHASGSRHFCGSVGEGVRRMRLRRRASAAEAIKIFAELLQDETEEQVRSRQR